MGHDNLGKGLDGERRVSQAIDELKIPHQHHDFSSVTAYAQTQGEGVDIWNSSLNFYIEVKHFPNSYLCGTGSYYAHIEPRFRDIPINGLKLVIQIKGWKNRSFISKCKQMGIYYIYVDDPKKLVSKLGYFLRIYGIMPEPHKDSKPHKSNCIEYELEPLCSVLSVSSSPAFASDRVFGGKGPPPSTSSSANLGIWFSATMAQTYGGGC